MPILQITIYEIRHFTLITELLTFPQTFHFLHAYLVERYCITVPLVLILFGGTAFPLKKKIFGVTASPLPSTAPLALYASVYFMPSPV